MARSLDTGFLFDPMFIGFDKFFETVNKTQNSYPPYNVVKESDSTYLIEIAVAGFNKDDLDITEQDGVLTIIGDYKDDVEARKYLHKGIATRKFTRTFSLHDDIKVKNAYVTDGLLQIVLEKHVPESKKPKRIAIGS